MFLYGPSQSLGVCDGMFRDCIKGLDRVFQGEIRPGKTILVTGPPGSLKSSFVHSLMKAYVERTGEFGLYTTLEQDTSSHLEGIESIGLGLSRNLQITDYSEILMDEYGGNFNYMEFTEMMIDHFKDRYGERFSIYGFDSLGALYSMMPEVNNPRKFSFQFFTMLKKHNLTSFVIMESSQTGDPIVMGNELFLCDGIFHLGIKRSRGHLTRYFQVIKLRSTKHSMDPFAMKVDETGIEILGPLLDLS